MPGCAVVNCKGNRLFRFPASPRRRAIWVQFSRRSNWTPSSGSRLCKMHFEMSQYETYSLREGETPKLRQTAVPTLFDIPNPPKRLDPKRRTRKRTTTEIQSGDYPEHNYFKREEIDPSPYEIYADIDIKEEPAWFGDVTNEVEPWGGSASEAGDDAENGDVDPLGELGQQASPPEYHCIKREPPTPESTTTETGESSDADHQGDLGVSVAGDFAFCSVIGMPAHADGRCTTEPIATNGVSGVQVEPMQDEVSSQSRSREYMCDACGAKVRSRSAIERHVGKCVVGLGKTQSKAGLVVRGTKFPTTVGLQSHGRTHRLHGCRVYGAKFLRRSDLNVHSRQTVFACDVCEVRLSSVAHLRAHRRVHTRRQPHAFPHTCKVNTTRTCWALFSCNVCGAKFAKSSSANIHAGIKPHTCNSCKAKLATGRDLARHERTHGGSNKPTCEVRGGKFVRTSGLNVHVRPRAGVKLHGCDFCNARFSTTSSLMQHRWYHTSVKPFGCEECKIRFTTSHALTIHQRLHSGDRPYTCEMCSASFVSNSGLASHRKLHKTT